MGNGIGGNAVLRSNHNDELDRLENQALLQGGPNGTGTGTLADTEALRAYYEENREQFDNLGISFDEFINQSGFDTTEHGVSSDYGEGTVTRNAVDNDARNGQQRRANRANEKAEREALQQIESDWETRGYVDASDRNVNQLGQLITEQDRLQGMSSQESAGWQDATGNRAMIGALGQMQGIASAGGWTPLEQAQNAQAQFQANQAAQANRGALQQQYQMRGMGGSGMEMAAAMQANQGGANASQAAATQLSVAGQNRALNAIQSAYTMGQGRNQNQAQAGAAADNWNQTNFQNQAAVQGATQGDFNTRVQTNAAQEAEDAKNGKRGKIEAAVGDNGIGGLIG